MNETPQIILDMIDRRKNGEDRRQAPTEKLWSPVLLNAICITIGIGVGFLIGLHS
jgi:hypothetical protein